jgi:hypothetical protein
VAAAVAGAGTGTGVRAGEERGSTSSSSRNAHLLPRSLLGRLVAEFPTVDIRDYVLFCALRSHGELPNAGPVSEQVISL